MEQKIWNLRSPLHRGHLKIWEGCELRWISDQLGNDPKRPVFTFLPLHRGSLSDLRGLTVEREVRVEVHLVFLECTRI